MRRSTFVGVGVLVLVLAALVTGWWQRPRLERMGLGARAELGPLEASVQATVMPSRWGSQRCRPDLWEARRTHRHYPPRLDMEPGSVFGLEYGVGEVPR